MSKNYLQLASDSKKKSSEFPSEAEVRRYVVPGMNEEDVIKKFGIPGLRTPLESDGEVLYYNELPSQKEVSYGYGGFEVFIKKGKVTDMRIIHQSVRISK